MKRHAVLIGILVVLVGISAYMWSKQSGDETDMTIAKTMERYKCQQCGAEFQLTNADATEMHRKGAGVVCPTCNQVGAEKQDVKVFLGSLGSGDSSEPEPDPEKPPDAAGGVRRIVD